MARRALVLDYPDRHDLGNFDIDSAGFKAREAEIDREQARRRDTFWKKRDWLGYIFIHARGHRWHALERVAEVLNPKRLPTLAGLFRAVWIDAEDIWQQRRRILSLVRLIGEGREHCLMTAEDLERFRALPERLKVYRGAKPWNLSGMSWTTDVDRACTFAMHTHDGAFPASLSREHGGCVYERILNKSDVLFYTNARSEDEIITRRFLRGKLSPMGVISLALSYDGPDAALAQYERHRSELDPDALAELTPEILAFWRAVGEKRKPTRSNPGQPSC